MAGASLLGLLPLESRAKGWKERPLQRCERREKYRLQLEAVKVAAKTTAEELERLWNWSGSIIEEMEELRAAIARLYADEEGRS